MAKAKSVAELKEQMERLSAELATIQAENVNLAKEAGEKVAEAIEQAGEEITIERLNEVLSPIGYKIRYAGKVLPFLIPTLTKEMESSKGGILDFSGKEVMAMRAKELQVSQQDLRATLEDKFNSYNPNKDLGRTTKWKGLKE